MNTDLQNSLQAYSTLFLAVSQLTDQMAVMQDAITERDAIIQKQAREIFELQKAQMEQAKKLATLEEFFFKLEGVAINTAFNQRSQANLVEAMASVYLPKATLSQIEQENFERQREVLLLQQAVMPLALTHEQVSTEELTSTSSEIVSVSPPQELANKDPSLNQQNDFDLENEKRIAALMEQMTLMNPTDPRIQGNVEPQESKCPISFKPQTQKSSIPYRVESRKDRRERFKMKYKAKEILSKA